MAQWNYDHQRMAWICDDGRFVTDQQLHQADPFVAQMMRQVLNEAVGRKDAPRA